MGRGKLKLLSSIYCHQVVLGALSISSLALSDASAQQFGTNTDPRPILGQIISAFQNCGPPQVYQMLGMQLYQVVWNQTMGRGCYQEIARAGPVSQMVVANNSMLPDGPVFAVRVTHSSGIVADWYIGLSNFTGRVEYLTFTGAGAAMPNASQGPVDNSGQPTGKIPEVVPPVVNTSVPECDLYKAMCQ